MTSHGIHLAESEFVDLLDGTLAAARRQHLDELCQPARQQAADLADRRRRRPAADVPEPPPFFWTQLSARVQRRGRRRSGQAGHPGGAWGSRWARTSWFAAAAAIAAGVLAVVALRSPGDNADG